MLLGGLGMALTQWGCSSVPPPPDAGTSDVTSDLSDGGPPDVAVDAPDGDSRTVDTVDGDIAADAPEGPQGSDAADADLIAPDAPDGPDAAIDGRVLTGFIFEGPLDPIAPGSGLSYRLEPATGSGPPGAAVGSPCTSGNDCAALGANAACFLSAGGGFCTYDCDQDPEGPSVICPAGTACFVGLRSDSGRLCLRTCTTQDDCDPAGTGMQCSGSLFTFNPPVPLQHVCLPSCTSDADCNIDTSQFICDLTLSRCQNPHEIIGAACQTNADCLGLGPGGTCLKSQRDPTASYCTLACDPGAAVPCPLGGPDGGGSLGPCLSTYATTADGTRVPVCLAACSSDRDCQSGSVNTCNYVPVRGGSLCTIACTSDDDCFDGQCNPGTGDCQVSEFFSPRCTSDSNCSGGLCVTDFHHPTQHNCTQHCGGDGDCPAGSVCVTSPVAVDGSGLHLDTDGFCAPACATVGGRCDDPTSTCLEPHDPPEIDFAGSGNASSNFCWR
jgi:hypothetical protein